MRISINHPNLKFNLWIIHLGSIEGIISSISSWYVNNNLLDYVQNLEQLNYKICQGWVRVANLFSSFIDAEF